MITARDVTSVLTRLAAHHRLQFIALACGLVPTVGCATGPDISDSAQDSRVGDYAHSGCSTAVVIGLARQIAREADCENPGHFVKFPSGDGITRASSAVLPFLALHARDDLETVAHAHPLTITSALRTVPQQYLLYRWWQEGRCGITAAALPGTSNHEGGRAVDVANWSTRVSAMAAHGWRHDVPGDPVHFDHTATPDRRGEDVHAFQVLWNRNHPNDKIATDGAYGPDTEARLVRAPATGFAKGASCVAREEEPVVAVDGADLLPPLTQQHFAITLANTGDTDWPAGARIELTGGTSSPLFDPSWASPTVVATLAVPIPAGGQGIVDVDITTPAATDPTAIEQGLQLTDGTNVLAQFDVAVTVDPGMTGPTSSDGGDAHDDGEVDGGCNAGGGAGGLAPLALALVGLVRRRRARR